MKEPAYIYFNSPPSPYYLESGFSDYQIGDSHPNRHRINLFDLIIVGDGCLHLAEEDKCWKLAAGECLILLPDRHHHSVVTVYQDTSSYWIQFKTVYDWI